MTFETLSPGRLRALCSSGEFSGATLQYIAQQSALPFCITHSPGKMLVTDLTNG